MEKNEISYFKNCRAKKPEVVTIEFALHWIKTGYSKKLINSIREATDQQTKDLLKQKLPGVTFGCLLQDRSTLIKASGFACLDFDKVNNLNELKEGLKGSNYIYSFWISPSGNGIKALVKIPIVESKEEYKQYYTAILSHFKALQPDPATKDINRLCFESYDPDLYLNPESAVFSEKATPPKRKKLPVVQTEDLPEGQVIDQIISWWVKKYPFVKGNRNNSLFILACALSNFGISQATTEDLFNSFEDEDFQDSEIQQIISSAYKKAEFNTETFKR